MSSFPELHSKVPWQHPLHTPHAEVVTVWQTPAEHSLPVPQLAQAFPLLPQNDWLCIDMEMQVVPKQHPVQVAPQREAVAQTPAVQAVPVAQGLQTLPRVPHSALL